MNITEEQLNFLESHNISLSEVFDATGLSRSQYQPIMKETEKIIAVGVTLCARSSHSMRTGAGHCVQCNTATIAYIERYYKKGHIYIAGSKKEKVVKVGFTSETTNRESSLNKQKYGEIDDWKILFFAMCKNAGKIECNTHKDLNKYLTDRSFVKNHKRNDCYEIFSCGYPFCKKTLDKNIGDKKNIIKFKEKTNLIGEYNFENIIFKRISKKQEYSV